MQADIKKLISLRRKLAQAKILGLQSQVLAACAEAELFEIEAECGIIGTEATLDINTGKITKAEADGKDR